MMAKSALSLALLLFAFGPGMRVRSRNAPPASHRAIHHKMITQSITTRSFGKLCIQRTSLSVTSKVSINSRIPLPPGK